MNKEKGGKSFFRFLGVKMEYFSDRDSRTVTRDHNVLQHSHRYKPFSDPIAFVLNPGQYVFVSVCFYNNNSSNASVILTQVSGIQNR